jgi:hypothetical protein
MAKVDVGAPGALDEINANVERVATLTREGNEEAARALETETETLISSLSGKGVVATKATLRANLREARSVPVEATPGAELDTVSYKELEGAEKAVQGSVRGLRAAVAAGRKLSTSAREAAEAVFPIRLVLRRRGLPDLMARSQGARDLAVDLKAAAREGVADDDFELLAQYDAADKAMSFQMSSVLVTFLRNLDLKKPEEVVDLFPGITTLPSFRDGKLTQAVYDLYDEVGIHLPLQSEAEKKAEAARARALAAKAEPTPALENGEAAAEAARTKLDNAKSLVSTAVKAAGKLSDSDRAALKTQIQDFILSLSAQAAEL